MSLTLPNVRKLFIPRPGHVIVECDLCQADARTVAWESDATGLKAIFADPSLSLHLENAKVIYGPTMKSKKDPRYKKAKAGIHALDFGCGTRKLSIVLGETIKETERFINTWFGAHPQIREWQRKIEQILKGSGRMPPVLYNAFGFRRVFFERTDGLLPEALAWIPQSTTAITINHGLIRLARTMPEIHLLLQVHDSIVMEYPIALDTHAFRLAIKECIEQPVPYPSPMLIPVDFKWSDKSWGECQEIKL